jgi:hypothetical protein
MTLKEIRDAVGRKCSLLDSQGVFIDGLVLEADLTAMANERWKYLHLKYANKFPQALTIERYEDLVEDQAIYSIGTTGSEEMDLTYVGIIYDSDDDYYKRVMPLGHKRLHKEDTDTSGFQQSSPYYYVVPGELGEGETHISERAIQLVPVPDESVTNGLFLRYVAVPVDMEAETDTPYSLPSLMHQLIVDYMVADVWQIKRDWANSNEAMGRATYNEKRFFDEHQPSSSDQPVRIDAGKRFRPNLR